MYVIDFQLIIVIFCFSNESRNLGFTFIIDMRGNANTSAGAKTALKILQEHFADFVHQVILIKPENFWQKQRSSISSNKYKFEVTTISIQQLSKMTDLSQLTNDFEGFLQYDHNQWLELRVAYEEFMWQANDASDHIEDYQEDLIHFDLAEDIGSCKHQIENNNDMKRKILKLPLDDLEAQGQKLLGKLNQYINRTKATSNNSSSQQTSSKVTSNNPDISDTINQVHQNLETLRNSQQQLLILWQQKKTKLEQCFQLRLFEQDCEKMFEWILHNNESFQQNYMNIGINHSIAKSLQEDHNRFAMTTMTVTVNIGRIMSVAGRLVESNHYASQHVRSLASRLDVMLKDFTNQLDERNTVLNYSVLFHHKAEQYAESVLSWSAAVEASIPHPCDAENLETAIRTHQSLYEAMCHAYTEVHSTSKKLLYQLDHLVQICNQPSSVNGGKSKGENGKYNNPAADYSEGATHVLNLIHQILSHHRALEDKWQKGKLRLHQKLALKLFQEDVKQVLDWLQNHGDVFLKKNIGIGRNLQKARIYQTSHEHFENVAQNTYRNAEKLLSAAHELSQSGEVAPAEIHSVVINLEKHVTSFAERVEQRRRRLDLAVLFYSNEKDLQSFINQLREDIVDDEALNLSTKNLVETERLLEQCKEQEENTIQTSIQTIAQGEALVHELRSLKDPEDDSTGSLQAVQNALERLIKNRDEFELLWKRRKLRIDLFLRLRIFERDVMDISSQLELWAEELQQIDLMNIRNYQQAEQSLRMHNDSVLEMQNTVHQIIQQGQDISQLVEDSGFIIMAEPNVQAVSRIQYLLEFLNDREIDFEEFAETKKLKLEQTIQLCHFQNDANQVISWIRNGESMLFANFAIPNTYPEAEILMKEHEQFQVSLYKFQVYENLNSIYLIIFRMQLKGHILLQYK